MERKPFFKTAKFKTLNDKWYKKLEANGFVDIENAHKGSPAQDLGQRIHFKPQIQELTCAYYSWACQQIHTGKFRCDRDKKIWIRHSEGLSAAAIGREFGVGRHRLSFILKLIRAYLKEQKNH